MTEQKRRDYVARAEACLMGYVINTPRIEELTFILDYIVSVAGGTESGEDIIRRATQYASEDMFFMHLSVNRVMGMYMITLTEVNADEEYDLCSEDGVLSYVYNVYYPDLSELGYTFFEENPETKRPHRVG